MPLQKNVKSRVFGFKKITYTYSRTYDGRGAAAESLEELWAQK